MPVSPEFQPPKRAPNYPPSFVSAEPFFFTTVAAHPQVFRVVVADPNPADTLYVRWVSDYPPFTANSELLVDDPKGQPQTGVAGTPLQFNAGQCERFGPGMEHRLVVIVSDRKFRPYDQFTSDFRFNLVEGDDATAIMNGWSIINCP